ncbi:MAG: urea carboxylase-associated family protein [Methylotenera sp.]|uniref:urea amidolyase associated protein UAAP1 n=1 Tax=Methylotenera sp. TaxID=2051956 RepID=UPI00271DB954|nr:urea amidolyase associated protein UAAP1 [Methylotenera sp.]MDO9393857.1 urea carboxylase-associated family protein [Methylotenera sp.]MDP2229343.1 urea carboxylase-associated family protein [Methylotenera sp.]MDP3141477.1 urea carboxylase-associated family protein [Methylotenera sp.]
MTIFDPTKILWEETVPGGHHWSGAMRRGSALRFTDLQGGANVSLLFYNMEEKLERYNMPDTLKAQHTAFLTTGNVCYSDMGRVMCSFVHDDTGWHDTICGLSDADLIEKKYGVANYQTHRNKMYRNAKDGLLVELAKYGLGKPDMVANVNLFSKVSANNDGLLTFKSGNSKAGSVVDLRFDMNVLVVLSTAPHPLDTAKTYSPGDVMLTAWHAGVATDNDVCRNSCEQNQRGFINTERYFAN